jgi:hypothetical protein
MESNGVWELSSTICKTRRIVDAGITTPYEREMGVVIRGKMADSTSENAGMKRSEKK